MSMATWPYALALGLGRLPSPTWSLPNPLRPVSSPVTASGPAVAFDSRWLYVYMCPSIYVCPNFLNTKLHISYPVWSNVCFVHSKSSILRENNCFVEPNLAVNCTW